VGSARTRASKGVEALLTVTGPPRGLPVESGASTS
jgi:hypothetical protein